MSKRNTSVTVLGNKDLLTLSWPLQRLVEALEALARRSELASWSPDVRISPAQLGPLDGETLGQRIKTFAGRMNLEAEEVSSSYAELEQVILHCGPALLRVNVTEEPRFLALLGHRGRKVSLLDPQLREHKVHPSLICIALRQPLEAPLATDLDRLLKNVGVSPRKQYRARKAILRERLSGVTLSGFWILRSPPSENFARQLRRAGALRDIGLLAGAHALQYSLWLLAWWVIGHGALQGRIDYSWLVAWALLLLTIIPLRLLTTWKQGALAIGAGGLLKKRLLYGALHLDPEQIRHQGAGQLLGRIIETEAVESLALSGGFQGLLAVIELCMAAVVLKIGSGGWPHTMLLLFWVGATSLIVGHTFGSAGAGPDIVWI